MRRIGYSGIRCGIAGIRCTTVSTPASEANSACTYFTHHLYHIHQGYMFVLSNPLGFRYATNGRRLWMVSPHLPLGDKWHRAYDVLIELKKMDK